MSCPHCDKMARLTVRHRDLSNARCLSLACHAFSDCVDALKRSVNCVAKKDLFTDRPVEWPPFPPSVCINDGQTRERRFAISSWVVRQYHISQYCPLTLIFPRLTWITLPTYPNGCNQAVTLFSCYGRYTHHPPLITSSCSASTRLPLVRVLKL